MTQQTTTDRKQFSLVILVILFGLAHSFAYGMTALLSYVFDVIPRTDNPTQIALILLTFFIIAIGQGIIVKTQLAWAMNRWIVASLLGILTIFFFIIVNTFIFNNLQDVTIIFMFIFGAGQILELRHRIKYAPLWSIIVAVSSIPYRLISLEVIGVLANLNNEFLLVVLNSTIIGLIEGVIIGIALSILVNLSNQN